MGLIFTRICQETELKECDECNELQEIIYNKMDIIKDLNQARELQYNYIINLERQIDKFYNDDI